MEWMDSVASNSSWTTTPRIRTDVLHHADNSWAHAHLCKWCLRDRRSSICRTACRRKARGIVNQSYGLRSRILASYTGSCVRLLFAYNPQTVLTHVFGHVLRLRSRLWTQRPHLAHIWVWRFYGESCAYLCWSTHYDILKMPDISNGNHKGSVTELVCSTPESYDSDGILTN